MKPPQFTKEEKNLFTEDEKKLLVECLLFASCTDICAEWSPERSKDMLKLAKKLNEPTIKLDEVYLFEADIFEDTEAVNNITENFPNLPRANIFTSHFATK